MRKAIQTSSSALLLASCANAIRANHPFVGEHADASAVQHDSGSVSMRLGAKKTSYNKHSSFVTKEGLFEPNRGFFGRISDTLFGSTVTDPSRGSHKKLGAANFATILSNDDGFMWTGEIYMGKLTKMDMVYDTGSDWLVVEGAECTNCEGNTYDI
jgi:hypothetical protein